MEKIKYGRTINIEDINQGEPITGIEKGYFLKIINNDGYLLAILKYNVSSNTYNYLRVFNF